MAFLAKVETSRLLDAVWTHKVGLVELVRRKPNRHMSHLCCCLARDSPLRPEAEVGGARRLQPDAVWDALHNMQTLTRRLVVPRNP